MSNFSNNMDAWNRHKDPGSYAIADAIKKRDKKVAALESELERYRTAVNAVYGWTKQGDSTPDKLRVALMLVSLLEENNETA